jgi:hypothetical protein
MPLFSNAAFTSVTALTESMIVNAVNTLSLSLDMDSPYLDGDVLTVKIREPSIEYVGVGNDVMKCISVR